MRLGSRITLEPTGVRFEVLRSVAIDLGAAIARNGFKNILLIHAHGMPLHNVAFTDAAAFVSQRYQVHMVNITSLVYGQALYTPELMRRRFGDAWQKTLSFDVHAGAVETSAALSVRGDLVKAEYRHLDPFLAKDLDELLRMGHQGAWLGYFGSPAKASKALGHDLIDDWVNRSLDVAERALNGEDLSAVPTYPNTMPASEREHLENEASARYAKESAEIEAWLKKR